MGEMRPCPFRRVGKPLRTVGEALFPADCQSDDDGDEETEGDAKEIGIEVGRIGDTDRGNAALKLFEGKGCQVGLPVYRRVCGGLV